MNISILGKIERRTIVKLPLYMSKVAAGFPSPAQDYVEQTLDLNELCVKRPAATFFVRVEGDSMIEAGILSNDILIVDRSVRPAHGDIVVAQVNNEFTVKELQLKPKLMLVPRNSAFSPIELADEAELQIFGVVTNVLRQMTRSSKN
ncbi:translesion error-prone DNA polymerase V autoproteolytic subunit [Rheinheimera sp. F8]|uniref:translesion error-prone DNA polymerase V autoproteolytic subunit n=1 Tax=Rheinheimera sp. F8 TaxID=1763998 RepID=UPI000744A782|nr:translesion error-prone DNA polymerase V autoproteolytic subunit [Rheinheimera sp. F8]ALZ77866.1 UV protection and mutation protein [Rheinheimera sp. F8]ALZ77900.1 UV protection and mutation protein [Rheinheimera sp. F8]